MENAKNYFPKTKTEIEKYAYKAPIANQYKFVWLPNVSIDKNYCNNLQKIRPDTDDFILLF